MTQELNLRKAFSNFLTNPTPNHAWILQQNLLQYAAMFPNGNGKNSEIPIYKTKKGEKWDVKLAQILEICIVYWGWEVEPFTTKFGDAWRLTDSQKHQAILYLGDKGFSMGNMVPEPLTGEFESLEDKIVFRSWLKSYGVSLED